MEETLKDTLLIETNIEIDILTKCIIDHFVNFINFYNLYIKSFAINKLDNFSGSKIQYKNDKYLYKDYRQKLDIINFLINSIFPQKTSVKFMLLWNKLIKLYEELCNEYIKINIIIKSLDISYNINHIDNIIIFNTIFDNKYSIYQNKIIDIQSIKYFIVPITEKPSNEYNTKNKSRYLEPKNNYREDSRYLEPKNNYREESRYLDTRNNYREDSRYLDTRNNYREESRYLDPRNNYYSRNNWKYVNPRNNK